MRWRRRFGPLVLLVLGAAALNLWSRIAAQSRALPCPPWLAWVLEGSVVDRLLGTDETLDRLGLRPGERLLEIGPGPGRLLIPAARRVRPGGEAVGLELQPGTPARPRDRFVLANVWAAP